MEEPEIMVPESRPQQDRLVTLDLLARKGVTSKVAILGVRGYFLNAFGLPHKGNTVGIYDDAIFLISDDIYLAVNANVDPSSEADGVANLAPGLWNFEMSIHGKTRPAYLQYPCLEQFGPVTVQRFGKSDPVDTGMFAIQMHKGCHDKTASLGCQTIWPDQYDEFIKRVSEELDHNEQTIVPYLLMEYEGGHPPL